jgi:hypothetical protein
MELNYRVNLKVKYLMDFLNLYFLMVLNYLLNILINNPLGNLNFIMLIKEFIKDKLTHLQIIVEMAKLHYKMGNIIKVT